MLGSRLSSPRRRRRIWLPVLAGLLVALVIGDVANQVVSSSGAAATRSTRSWIAAVAPLVDQSSSLSVTLGKVRNGSSLQRAQLDALLGELEGSARQLRRDYSALELAPPTPASGAALGAVFADRARAATELSGAIALAMDNAAATGTAEQTLAKVAVDLRAGDAAYRRFRQELPHHGARRLGSSVWLRSPSAWSAPALAVWVSVLSRAQALVGRRQLSLLAVSLQPRVLKIDGLPTTTVPTPTTTTTTTTTLPTTGSALTGTTTTVGHRRRPRHHRGATTTTTPVVTTTTLQIPPAGSVSLVQATSRLTVTVVVASTGNLPVDGALVQATLVPTGKVAASPERAAHHLRVLTPGNARYLTLGPLAVRSGATYRLQVTAGFPGGALRQANIALQVEP